MIPVLMALVAATGFAGGGIFARLAGRRVAVLTGTAVSVVASLLLAVIPALVLELPSLAQISLSGFLWVALLAFINYPLARTFNFTSVSKIGAARSVPLFSSAPLWSIILAVIFLGERPNGMIIAGTMAIVAGIILTVTENGSTKSGEETGDSRTVGYIFGLAAGICYGAWSVIAKTAIVSYDIPPIMLAGTAFFFGTLMFAPVLAIGIPRAFNASKRALAMFALAGMCAGVAIMSFSVSLEQGDVTVVTPIVSISPLITLVLVRVFLERLDRVSLRLVLGALLVVGGTVLVVVGDSVI